MKRMIELTEDGTFRKGTDGYVLAQITPHRIVIYLDSFRQGESEDEELKGTPEDMMNLLNYCTYVRKDLEVKFSNAQDKNGEI